MPNWCEGILKLRGKKKNLIKFVENTLIRYIDNIETYKTEEIPLEASINEYGGFFVPASTKLNRDWIYFKDSKRMFVTSYIDWDFYEEKENHIYIQQIDVKQAWNINSEYLLKIAQDYDLDIKIMAFEKGMQFTREIEIIDGKIINDIKTEYGNEYKWKVYDFRLGG